jgi:metal-responsive CopG/Arc/MetJ family transcriptional regulator
LKEIILKPKKERDSTFSIRVEKELLISYEELSGITGYSRNQLINNAMKYYLENVKIETTDDQILNKVAEFQQRHKQREL